MAQEMKMLPMGPRFIALRYEREEVSPGGVLIPPKARVTEGRQQPEVVVVRASTSLIQEHGDLVKPGTRMLLGTNPQTFEYDEKEYLMVDWSMVKGIYE